MELPSKSSPGKRHLYATWRGPRSKCTCGHYGDGTDTEHANTFLKGHGGCLVKDCNCVGFVWAGFARRFAKALEMVG